MTEDEARAEIAKATAKKLAQQAYNKRKRMEEKVRLTEALAVIAAADRAAKANGEDHG